MEAKYDKRIKPQKEREIYRPGSGPLRRTDPSDSKYIPNKSDQCIKFNHVLTEKLENVSDKECSETSITDSYISSSKLIDKDKKKLRKPDATLYIPKQRTKQDNESISADKIAYDSPSSSSTSTFESKVHQKQITVSKDRSINRVFDSNVQSKTDDSNYNQNKIYVETKQFVRGNKNEASNWRECVNEDTFEMKKLDKETENFHLSEKNNYRNPVNNNTSCNVEYRNSKFYNRHGNDSISDRYKSDRENNGEKNRNSRNSSRRESNMLMLPEAFSSWPPRLRRQFLTNKGIKAEDADKYLRNKNNVNINENRSIPALPLKSKQSSHYKTNKPKDISKNNQDFSRQTKYNDESIKLKLYSPEKRQTTSPINSSNVTSLSEENKDTNEGTSDICNKYDFSKNLNNSSSAVDVCTSKNGSEENYENFNWAEEVEREKQSAERNASEADNYCNEEFTRDKRNEKKKRKRREFRKRSGYERNQQKNRDQDDATESRKIIDDDKKCNIDANIATVNESTNAYNDSYLSWRKNKHSSPSRKFGILGRNTRVESKNDHLNISQEKDKCNRFKTNNKKVNDISSHVKEQINSSGEKDKVAGILKIPLSQTGSLDLKCSPPPVFPVPQSQHHSIFTKNKPLKQLYNPTNPKQPIIVSGQSVRAPMSTPGQTLSNTYNVPTITAEHTAPVYIPNPYLDPSVSAIVSPNFMTEQYMMSKPAWYDAYSESFRSTNNAHLLLDISRADSELQTLLIPGTVIHVWERIVKLRIFLQGALKTLLTSDLKFCEAENVEQHMWKILFYNVIELLRKCIAENNANSQTYKNLLFSVIDEGTDYFCNLLTLLEHVYKIKLDDFFHAELITTKGLGYAGLAIISAQKIFLFLGDLARYKESYEESSNFSNSRQWYIKANQLNPRNGRPYNQLAILSVYGRRKFDAVYYYMRSLMASNPFFTARESLLALFDENRKKYEQIERIRREQEEKKKQEKAKEKESVINGSMLRKEIWIRPDDGKRVQRTTSTSQDCNEESDDGELANLTVHEVNKKFFLSFLHVHGKLFSKVGMETLQEAAIEMLKEFKALLNYSPLAISGTRLSQLLALNMFAIDNGQLKDPQIEVGYHSAVQESALVISLQMFNLIVNRCIQLLKEQLLDMKRNPDQISKKYPLVVNSDVQLLLPAIKLWCDWLFCHSSVWNPPPSCQDYRISGCSGDCWIRLATLVNILEELDYSSILQKIGINKSILITSNETYENVKISLEEDVTLRGFTPLMCNTQQTIYTYKDVDMELSRICLRIDRILFFGTVFLCGIDPPVLKLHKTENGSSEYISVVEEIVSPKNQSDDDNAEDRWSGSGTDEDKKNCDYDHENKKNNQKFEQYDVNDKSLLSRKKELERIHKKREKYMRDKKETINKEIAAFSVEMEIRPHYLVPDTNCFIDCLSEIKRIAKAVSSTQRLLYSLMVPLIVLNELEGIARGARKVETVSENARIALHFIQNSTYPNIKCVTTRGSVLPSTRITNEEDYSKVEKNDDKILTTCLNLCKHYTSSDNTAEQSKKIYREVVLLTEDRNLRVKALSSNMPVQTVTDFIKWAGL